MKVFLRSLVERIPSDFVYLALMRMAVVLLGARVKVELRQGLVVLDSVHYLPSVRRLPFYVRGLTYRAERLNAEYMLNLVGFENGDVVVDCGANVGDLLLMLRRVGKNIRYIGFEPGFAEYSCLVKNTIRDTDIEVSISRSALSDRNGTSVFYESADSADGALLKSSSSKGYSYVDTVRLDEALSDVPNVKLLKLEAEGFEPEVLYGAERVIDRIQYISADVGFERGEGLESTLPEVVNFLAAQGFKVLANSRDRCVVLFHRG